MFHFMRQAYALGNRANRLGIYSCLNRYVTVSAKARNGFQGSMLAATPRLRRRHVSGTPCRFRRLRGHAAKGGILKLVVRSTTIRFNDECFPILQA